MFKVSIMDPRHTIFEGMAYSVILPGDAGEFEVLNFHRPIISLLKEGSLVIDGVDYPIHKGIAGFYRDELIALVEI